MIKCMKYIKILRNIWQIRYCNIFFQYKIEQLLQMDKYIKNLVFLIYIYNGLISKMNRFNSFHS